MKYHKIRIRRFIVLYIIVFGFLGSMLIMFFFLVLRPFAYPEKLFRGLCGGYLRLL